MRQALAIFIGWLIHIVSVIFILILFFLLFFSELKGMSKTEVTDLYLLEPMRGLKTGLFIITSEVISLALSATLAGWIARKKGWIVGGVVAVFIPFLGILGGISRKQILNISFEGAALLIIIISVGAFFGFLGEKLAKKSI